MSHVGRARAALLVGACGVLACAGPRVQPALVPQVGAGPAVAAPAGTPAPGIPADPADPPDDPALRWIITPADTRIELHARSAFLEPTFTFRRFRAHLSGMGSAKVSFHAELETASLDGGGGLAPFVRDNLLEARRYPRVSFDGQARCSPGTDTCAIDGTLDLHGVQRALHFEGSLRETPDLLRLVAVFELPRKPFNVRLPGAWDAFVADDVRVVIDARAHREHVVVETVAPPAP